MILKAKCRIVTAAIFSLIFSLTTAAAPTYFAGNFASSRNEAKKSAAKTGFSEIKISKKDNAPTEPLSEEVLTQSLLSKLKKDYKTTNIVIALDEMNAPTVNSGKEIFKGSGEVRIGFDWQKIDYTVTVDSNTKAAKVVDYSVK